MWTGIAQSFIAFLRLFSHFIIRGWTILTTIGRCSGGAGSSTSRHWKRLVVVESYLVWALSRASRKSCVFLG
ncbi:uncharacterized protein CCOS01_10945 [Colletotrichum costaricense]|uniref:Uncharacterized protein n=2 Tax=Colletotrichum acutatum species complex TaxID=2707335 RepID=A0AAI9YRZ2_9PEZI|nr:uncharacterized protein CCOS01_10945 [Colletotrichum costaricense]XP_060385627.1 uncharacterized protein CTAM01_03385 [Colletotrichum tamarilloi]KAI3552070.1 hypothetical protein CSPX01_00746 [Colletotrichum filicis]KAK1506050.1 hypothetical protein CTAM01_03385 [Colletotrichum tamarilloi]KAK1520826.1 hypothetical protein CCOS01_10945 [Colletotrichum costaricense]